MARIAVIVSNPCTGDARVIKMAQAAAQAGHEVHVFATMGPQTKPYEKVDGVNYHRIEWRLSAMMTRKGMLSKLQRLHRKTAGMIVRRSGPFVKYRQFRKLFGEAVASIKPDIVHAHDLICLPAGYEAAKLSGAKLVYDAHELEVHRNPPLPFLQKRWVHRVEKKYARRADAVITVGQLVGQELSRSIRRKDINVLYNSPIIEPCANNIRTDLRLEDEDRLIVYVGKVTQGRGVQTILDMLPKIPGAVLAAVGPCDASTKSDLENQASRNGLSARFFILPPVPYEQVVEYIRGADVGIIPIDPTSLSYRYSMPNKLFEMAFANIPILSNTLDEIEMFLKENGNGLIVDFEQLELVPYTISVILENPDKYRMDKAAYARLSERYAWDMQVKKLLDIYNRILPSKAAP